MSPFESQEGLLFGSLYDTDYRVNLMSLVEFNRGTRHEIKYI